MRVVGPSRWVPGVFGLPSPFPRRPAGVGGEPGVEQRAGALRAWGALATDEREATNMALATLLYWLHFSVYVLVVFYICVLACL